MSACGPGLARRFASSLPLRAQTPLALGCLPGQRLCSKRARSEEEQHGASRWTSLAGALGASALAVAQLSQPGQPAQCYFEKHEDGSEDRLARWQGDWNAVAKGKNPTFHLKEPNKYLVKHIARLVGDSAALGDADHGPAVFVPLCGKSVDMAYLCGHGLSVVGVDGVARAVVDFREEQRCTKKKAMYEPDNQRPVCLKGFKMPKQLSLGAEGWGEFAGFEPAAEFEGSRAGKVFKHGREGLGYYADSPKVWKGRMAVKKAGVEQPISIIQGDMFDVTPGLIDAATDVKGGTFHFMYDREAFVALPPAARQAYAQRLASLLKPGGRILMIAMEYDQAKVPYDPSGKKRNPPPFSTSMRDLRRAFSRTSCVVELIDSEAHDNLEQNPIFAGVEVTSKVYLITKSNQPSTGFGLGSAALIGAALTAAGVGAYCQLGA